MFYGQKNYNDKQGNGPYTLAQIGCFVTAFCNLEQRFGKNIDPSDLNKIFTQRGIYLNDPADGKGVHDDLGWPSITAYDGQIHVTGTGGPGWPSDNNAIVKFAYIGPRTKKPTTHFCLVADSAAHTIVDSWDGVVRTPGYYGTPVAWATYANTIVEPVTPPPSPKAPPTPAPVAPVSQAVNGAFVTLNKGDTLTSLGLRYGFGAQELLDHNGWTWDDARHLPVGTQVRLPIKLAPDPAKQAIQYEVLPTPKVFHISKAGGTDKWAFGNVKQWSDFVSNGHVPENTNITVVGIAKVLVGKDVAAYYMDANSFGDYATSGKIANTLGYNWKDLTEGQYNAPAPVTPEPIIPAPTPVVVAEPAGTALPPPPIDSPNAYKSTYKGFPQPELYISKNTIMIKELDGRRPDHQLLKNQGVVLSGTFIKDNVLYGRPTAGINHSGYWFGVPMDAVDSEAVVFDSRVELADKVAAHYPLSSGERVDVFLSFLLGQYTKLMTIFGKKNK